MLTWVWKFQSVALMESRAAPYENCEKRVGHFTLSQWGGGGEVGKVRGHPTRDSPKNGCLLRALHAFQTVRWTLT